MGIFERQREKYIVESRANPVGRLPQDLSRAIIYGNPQESNEALEQLRAWSVSTNTQILDAEYGYLYDARAQVGFGSRKPITIGEITTRLSALGNRLLPRRSRRK